LSWDDPARLTNTGSCRLPPSETATGFISTTAVGRAPPPCHTLIRPGWLRIGEKYEHTYDIKHARSGDGINWQPDGRAAVAQRTEYEALTRPYVVRRADGYHMWFCYRGSHSFRDGADAYRIGYAYSDDLQTWRRDDERSGISPSADGWDARMVAYPSIITVGGRTYLFYNGKDFGAEGFGYASWED
jgi:hypothetical protein